MKEVLDELLEAYTTGSPSALATVVRTWRSAPRPAGASMLVTEGGEAVGSVSGGCVEGALYELGQETLATGLGLSRGRVSQIHTAALQRLREALRTFALEPFAREFAGWSRPSARNALPLAMLAALHDSIACATDDPAVQQCRASHWG